VDGSETSRNRQATADVTLATIISTVVVLVLTVGLPRGAGAFAVQLASDSDLVDRVFYAVTAPVVIGGVERQVMQPPVQEVDTPTVAVAR
jgi:mannose/fructose/N-acetylgalactosamine-specific phosphotransferase system component IIC